jgi:hypothetical protein
MEYVTKDTKDYVTLDIWISIFENNGISDFGHMDILLRNGISDLFHYFASKWNSLDIWIFCFEME